MVEGEVFDHVVVGRDLDKIEGMLSGPSVFDKFCGTLIIRGCGFLRGCDYPAEHYGWEVLAKLIRKMKGVHTVK